jgi:NAD(P)-dependent dehydrogenase (short-subunit alcohol dehydrogenase family)
MTLQGKVALVAGGTRGAGRAIAVELGRAGATVYVTGRTTRERRSEVNRPETIEDTADLVKVAAQRMALAQAEELRPYGGTAVAVTPGWLRSEAMLELYGVTEENWRDATKKEPHFCIAESPAYVGRAVAALAADPDVARWSGQTLSSGGLAKVYGFTDIDGTQPDAWRYITEVREAGRPADDTGYR